MHGIESMAKMTSEASMTNKAANIGVATRAFVWCVRMKNSTVELSVVYLVMSAEHNARARAGEITCNCMCSILRCTKETGIPTALFWACCS